MENDKKYLRMDITFKNSENQLNKSVSIEFRNEFTALLDKYFGGWNTVCYEFVKIKE